MLGQDFLFIRGGCMKYTMRGGEAKIGEMEAIGFVRRDGLYVLRKNLPKSGFFTELAFLPGTDSLDVRVYEKTSGERYAIFDMPGASGPFVSAMRDEVRRIVDDVSGRCVGNADIREKYVSYVEEAFSCRADYPWENTPDYCVFRCGNGKWFALVMRITLRQLGLEGDGNVSVVNLKADAEKISAGLVDRKSVFPAYHMNKKYWITVLLSSATDFDFLCRLTERSYGLVSKR